MRSATWHVQAIQHDRAYPLRLFGIQYADWTPEARRSGVLQYMYHMVGEVHDRVMTRKRVQLPHEHSEKTRVREAVYISHR